MHLLAKVFGPLDESSHIVWSVGKGLVGRLTFDKPDFEVLQHQEFWPSNLDTMTQSDWKGVDEAVRQGRTLEEARALKRLYGTVVGVRLVDPQSSANLGCITLHTSSSRPLNASEADIVAAQVTARATELARQVVYKAGLTAKLTPDHA